MIAGPRIAAPYPDRHIDCQAALEPRFLSLLDAAVAAGWSRPEAIAAVIDLADNTALGDADLEHIDSAIKQLDP